MMALRLALAIAARTSFPVYLITPLPTTGELQLPVNLTPRRVEPNRALGEDAPRDAPGPYYSFFSAL